MRLENRLDISAVAKAPVDAYAGAEQRAYNIRVPFGIEEESCAAYNVTVRITFF